MILSTSTDHNDASVIMPKYTDIISASERIVALEKEIEELEKSEGSVMGAVSPLIIKMKQGIFTRRSFEDAEKRVNRHHRMLHQYNEAKVRVKLMILSQCPSSALTPRRIAVRYELI